jgi:hypothetical protein
VSTRLLLITEGGDLIEVLCHDSQHLVRIGQITVLRTTGRKIWQMKVRLQELCKMKVVAVLTSAHGSREFCEISAFASRAADCKTE